MGKFARIIDLEDGEQVLITIGYDEDTETETLCLQTDVEGVVAKLTFSFKNKEAALNLFNQYTVEKATALRQEVISELNKLS